jgi:hypothetical protein
MKNFCLATLLFLFCALPLYGNDGAFYVSGNTLMPLEETQISLRKEVLKFYVRDFRWMDVTVDFEFYNPGAQKTVLVGFVTPPADGDVSDEVQAHPQIKDFTVTVNGRQLAYQMKRMKDTSFSADKLKIEGTDFVYYFKVDFRRGVNKIRHTYRFRGGEGVELQRDFDYQITTGKRWANKQIDDFELQIFLDNGIFAIPATFREDKKLAAWRIVGDGVIDGTPRNWFGEDSPQVRMAHLNSGYIVLNEKNFRPDFDIMLGEYNWGANWVDLWCEYGRECVEKETLEKIARYFTLEPYDGFEEADLAKLSSKELKYVRNYFYAARGYQFKDEEVRKFYSQFFWYKPNPALKAEEMKLSPAENAFLAKVKKVEAKRK